MPRAPPGHWLAYHERIAAMPSRLVRGLILASALLASERHAAAHPAPFSYVDLRVGAERVELIVIAHIFDVAHDLQVDPQELLLDTSFLTKRANAIAILLDRRVRLETNGVAIQGHWSAAEPLPDRKSISVRASYRVPRTAGLISVDAIMFPYDPAHQTFVNVYEDDHLTFQTLLDAGRSRLDYYPGSRQGALAIAGRFAPIGSRHVFLGKDHLVFLVGLLLLGGSTRHLARIVVACAAGNGLALLLTILHLVDPPARIIEPAIAIGIVYVGADNLLVRGGRDMRAWIAFAIGLIHGFWFALGLRAMDLPPRTIGWSLLSFDIGVELAQMTLVFGLGWAISVLRRRSDRCAHVLNTVGSGVVVAAGTYWFVQRVFFPAGLI